MGRIIEGKEHLYETAMRSDKEQRRKSQAAIDRWWNDPKGLRETLADIEALGDRTTDRHRRNAQEIREQLRKLEGTQTR